MVHPDLQGRGWGDGSWWRPWRHATALGLEQLLLSTRGGTPLPNFYAACGWTAGRRVPGHLRLSPDDYPDEHWFVSRCQLG